MASKEEGFFTVAEDEILEENEKEMISVAEDDSATLQPEVSTEAPANTDWLSSGKPEHFMVFLVNEMKRFPKPSDVVGNISKIEQGLGQWKRLNAYVSRALREDYHGTLDVGFVDKARSLIEQNIEQLENMIDGINQLKKNRRQIRKRRGEEEGEGITKEGTAPHFSGFQMVITPFQSAISRALINGVVSGGRNMEELWEDVKKKYKMTDREELEIVQILADLGYPQFKDRLRVGENLDDPTRTENHGEWQSQYYA